MNLISKHKGIIWSTNSIIVLGVLTNVIIITTAYIYTPNLFWVLLGTIPLLVVGIYNVKQTNQILDRNRIIEREVAEIENRCEWLSHSIYPNKITTNDLTVQIGNEQCNQPYNACIFNIESKEITKTERPFIHSLSEEKREYSKYSVDEVLNKYRLAAGGLVWQIGSGYVGCRTENGNFNSKAFRQIARRPEVKMIELKLSAAIKPIYPVTSSLDIEQPIDRKIDNSIFPGSGYTNFREAEGMIHFLNSLRELSGGKPIGIRLCINDKKEFYQICYAIRKTQIIPDFIVVEGSFESTGIVNTDQAFHIGLPLYEALLFVSQTLQVYALEKEIKIIAFGRIISCFDILKVLALGANVVCTEMPDYRTNGGEIFSLFKDQNVNEFHNNLMKATVQAMKVCGFKNVGDISLSKFFRRLDILHSKGLENLNGPKLYPGTVKKIYNSQIKSYQIQEGRKKESMM